MSRMADESRRKPGSPMQGGRFVGVSRNRVFRCSDELWSAAQDKAQDSGTSVAEVLRAALVDYVGDDSLPTMGTPMKDAKD